MKSIWIHCTWLMTKTFCPSMSIISYHTNTVLVSFFCIHRFTLICGFTYMLYGILDDYVVIFAHYVHCKKFKNWNVHAVHTKQAYQVGGGCKQWLFSRYIIVCICMVQKRFLSFDLENKNSSCLNCNNHI